MLKRVRAVLACLALAPVVPATWSIILVDVRTGEIAIASATCLAGFDLKMASPVVLVGVGAAAAQSSIDETATNRLLIRDELRKGTPPAQILLLLAAQDGGHQTRQYGIVDTRGNAVGHTGSQASAWAGHLTGRTGDIVYAIQGNLLARPAVVLQAERAVIDTPGDLGQKMMAAMEVAAALGGDARCNPAKSADIAYFVIARQGDTDGTCSTSGCATGSYYLSVNIANQLRTDPDPVVQLRARHEAWRLTKRGRPDHNRSRVAISPTIPSDVSTTVRGRLVLRDIDDVPLTAGGANVVIQLDPASTAPVVIHGITDNGDGTYGFSVTAGPTAGTALLRVTVDDGSGPVLLSPRTALTVTDDPLWVSSPELSWTSGGAVDFVLRAPPATGAGRSYLLLTSASGSVPGINVGNLNVPVNLDGVLLAFYFATIDGALPTFLGNLDATGRAVADLALPPGAYGLPLGTELTFAFALLAPTDRASNPVRLRIER
jgi:uncharacterized Ntn-hydrolase superfamily protein